MNGLNQNLNNVRPRVCCVISACQGQVVYREPKEKSLSIHKELIQLNSIKKRRDEFMANGGTIVLNKFSNNVAKQIAEFKAKRRCS